MTNTGGNNPQDPFTNDHTDETTTFEAVDPNQPEANQPSTTRGVGGVLIGILLALVLVVVLLIAFLTGMFAPFEESEGDVVVETIVQDSPDGAKTPESTKDAQPVPRGEFPELPAGAVPANESARNGEPAGNFNNVWRDQAQTSESFAVNVREEYVRHYLETNEFDAVITVFSPVTGRNYQMDCKDNGQFVTCTGGNNAVVYIA